MAQTKDLVVDNITPVGITLAGPASAVGLQEQSSGNSADYQITAPLSSSPAAKFPAGSNRTLRNPTAAAGWPAGTTIGSVLLLSATTVHLGQLEDIE
jgi:hypothetical protein